jgi:hypothetical protein
MPDCHSVSSRPGLTRVAAGGLVLLAVLGPVLGGDPARAAAGSDRLLPGETLQAGQWISAGRDTLAMQGDGNLVLYAPGSTPIWATNTAGNDGAQLVMQTDGRGEDYIQSRYGRPCQAWTFWQARTYYGPLLAVVPF